MDFLNRAQTQVADVVRQAMENVAVEAARARLTVRYLEWNDRSESVLSRSRQVTTAFVGTWTTVLAAVP